MHTIDFFLNILLHIDTQLGVFFRSYGLWAYAILFFVIFCETGLVVTPFLPGDSLLFAVGALATKHMISLKVMIPLLILAAVSGDQVNFWIGRSIGHWLIRMKDRWYFKKSYLDRTHNFYDTYGGKTLIYARFVPIIRTYAPFVAGLGQMAYLRFCLFSVSGGILWIFSMIMAGYLFGNVPIIQEHFTVVVLGIIVVTLLPALVTFIRMRFYQKTTAID